MLPGDTSQSFFKVFFDKMQVCPWVITSGIGLFFMWKYFFLSFSLLSWLLQYNFCWGLNLRHWRHIQTRLFFSLWALIDDRVLKKNSRTQREIQKNVDETYVGGNREIMKDLVAFWWRVRILRQLSRVWHRYIPQWSWCAVGSLCNTVNLVVVRETIPWGKNQCFGSGSARIRRKKCLRIQEAKKPRKCKGSLG